MRKVVLFGVVLALASGCGRGWLPLFRGAPCNNNGCCASAIPASYGSGCANCDSSAGYSDYQNEFSGGDNYSGGSNYYSGGAITGDYPIQETIVSPSMVPPTTSAN
ncbi:MAG: hypothetical protein IT422_17920 [Pirellulaceae bacterium]|jgi:hypothetical protein|nr:hypothetical protein [Pirellulaceae bacterium]